MRTGLTIIALGAISCTAQPINLKEMMAAAPAKYDRDWQQNIGQDFQESLSSFLQHMEENQEMQSSTIQKIFERLDSFTLPLQRDTKSKTGRRPSTIGRTPFKTGCPSTTGPPAGSLPVGSLPVGSLPVGSPPVGSLPVGSVGFTTSDGTTGTTYPAENNTSGGYVCTLACSPDMALDANCECYPRALGLYAAQCAPGAYFDTSLNRCNCPAGLYFDKTEDPPVCSSSTDVFDEEVQIAQDLAGSKWIYVPSGGNAEMYNFKDTGKIDITYPTSSQKYPSGDYQWGVDEKGVYFNNKDGANFFEFVFTNQGELKTLNNPTNSIPMTNLCYECDDEIKQDLEGSKWLYVPSGGNAELYIFKSDGKIDITYPTSSSKYPSGDYQWNKIDDKGIYFNNKDGANYFEFGLNAQGQLETLNNPKNTRQMTKK